MTSAALQHTQSLCVVSMFVTPSASVVLYNFSKHLIVNYEEFLFEVNTYIPDNNQLLKSPTTSLLSLKQQIFLLKLLYLMRTEEK
jgi:hypothetical protein